METKMTDEKQLAHTILECSEALFFMKDREGRYLMASESFAALFGKAKGEIAGKTDFDFQPKELAEAYRANDQEVRSKGSPTTFKEDIFDRDGKKRTFLCHKFPVSGLSEYPDAVGAIALETVRVA